MEWYTHLDVWIKFPEFFDARYNGYQFVEMKEGRFEHTNRVSFTDSGYLVEAAIKNCNIPEALAAERDVYKKIMELIAAPLIEKIRVDFRSAEDIFREIREELVPKSLHDTRFVYEDVGTFYRIREFYDNRLPKEREISAKSLFCKGRMNLFEKVKKIGELSEESTDSAHYGAYKLAQSVNIDCERRFYCVIGNSLRGAARDALRIYHFADEINAFPLDIPGNRVI